MECNHIFFLPDVQNTVWPIDFPYWGTGKLRAICGQFREVVVQLVYGDFTINFAIADDKHHI